MAALRLAVGEIRHIANHHTLVRQGEPLDRSILLVEGMVARHKDLSTGERQITALHVAGDFVDLHGFTLKRLDHNISSLTPCTVAYFPHKNLRLITEQEPHLTRLLWLGTNVDAAMHREWELSLGRRDALARTAHLLCEILARLEVVGLTDAQGFDFPLTQTELAECVGLTPVHVNRTLRRLREQGLARVSKGRVEVLDRDGLAAAGDFRPDYLYIERHPY